MYSCLAKEYTTGCNQTNMRKRKDRYVITFRGPNRGRFCFSNSLYYFKFDTPPIQQQHRIMEPNKNHFQLQTIKKFSTCSTFFGRTGTHIELFGFLFRLGHQDTTIDRELLDWVYFGRAFLDQAILVWVDFMVQSMI